jgi:hypothetical protein
MPTTAAPFPSVAVAYSALPLDLKQQIKIKSENRSIVDFIRQHNCSSDPRSVSEEKTDQVESVTDKHGKVISFCSLSIDEKTVSTFSLTARGNLLSHRTLNLLDGSVETIRFGFDGRAVPGTRKRVKENERVEELPVDQFDCVITRRGDVKVHSIILKSRYKTTTFNFDTKGRISSKNVKFKELIEAGKNGSGDVFRAYEFHAEFDELGQERNSITTIYNEIGLRQSVKRRTPAMTDKALFDRSGNEIERVIITADSFLTIKTFGNRIESALVSVTGDFVQQVDHLDGVLQRDTFNLYSGETESCIFRADTLIRYKASSHSQTIFYRDEHGHWEERTRDVTSGAIQHRSGFEDVTYYQGDDMDLLSA